MVETHWDDLKGKEVRFRNNTWKFTGDVEVLQSGNLLAVIANQVDDVRHKSARLYFDLENPPASLNPGNLGEHFNSLDRASDGQYLVVKKEPRTYRYELQRLEYT